MTRVAAEDLVAALTAENDRHVLGGKPRDVVLRERTRARDRLVEMPDDRLELLGEVVRRRADDVMLGARSRGDGGRVGKLAVLPALGEGAAEDRHVAREHGDDARVEPTAQVGADRHVAAQPQAHGVLDERRKLLVIALPHGLVLGRERPVRALREHLAGVGEASR